MNFDALEKRSFAELYQVHADDFLYVLIQDINTTGAELVRAKDATQEEKRFASDYIEVISREGSERKVWQYDLACAFMAEYYKHVYIVDALIDD